MTLFHTWTIADAERLCDWMERVDHVETLTDGALADLIEKHLWADLPVLTSVSVLLAEVISRLRKEARPALPEAPERLRLPVREAELEHWVGLPDAALPQAQIEAIRAYLQERPHLEAAQEGGADDQGDA
jgi:hypothetical protein